MDIFRELLNLDTELYVVFLNAIAVSLLFLDAAGILTVLVVAVTSQLKVAMPSAASWACPH